MVTIATHISMVTIATYISMVTIVDTHIHGNMTHAANDTISIPASQQTLLAYEIILSIGGVMGIVCNIVACLAIGRTPSLRNANNFIVANINVAGALYSAFVIPIRVATAIHGRLGVE